MTELTRAFVERVVLDEIAADPNLRTNLTDVVCMAKYSHALKVRRRVWARIIAETSCSVTALARLWGCDESLIHGAGIKAKLASRDYDENTRARLISRWGWDRARTIIYGKDPATQADVAAWDRLGRKSGAAA